MPTPWCMLYRWLWQTPAFVSTVALAARLLRCPAAQHAPSPPCRQVADYTRFQRLSALGLPEYTYGSTRSFQNPGPGQFNIACEQGMFCCRPPLAAPSTMCSLHASTVSGVCLVCSGTWDSMYTRWWLPGAPSIKSRAHIMPGPTETGLHCTPSCCRQGTQETDADPLDDPTHTFLQPAYP